MCSVFLSAARWVSLLFLLDSSDCFQAVSTKVQTNEYMRNKSTCESLWMAVMEKRSNHLCRLLPQYAVQPSVSKYNHCVASVNLSSSSLFVHTSLSCIRLFHLLAACIKNRWPHLFWVWICHSLAYVLLSLHTKFSIFPLFSRSLNGFETLSTVSMHCHYDPAPTTPFHHPPPFALDLQSVAQPGTRRSEISKAGAINQPVPILGENSWSTSWGLAIRCATCCPLDMRSTLCSTP